MLLLGLGFSGQEHSQIGFDEETEGGGGGANQQNFSEFNSHNNREQNNFKSRGQQKGHKALLSSESDHLSNSTRAGTRTVRDSQTQGPTSKRKQSAPRRYVQQKSSAAALTADQQPEIGLSPGRPTPGTGRRRSSKETSEAEKKDKRSSGGQRRRTSGAGVSGGGVRKIGKPVNSKSTPRPTKKPRMEEQKTNSRHSPLRRNAQRQEHEVFSEPVTPSRVLGSSMDSLSLNSPVRMDIDPGQGDPGFVEDSFFGAGGTAVAPRMTGPDEEVAGSPELQSQPPLLQTEFSVSSQPFVPSSRMERGTSSSSSPSSSSASSVRGSRGSEPGNSPTAFDRPSVSSTASLETPTSLELRRIQQEALQSRQKVRLLQQTLEQERRSHEQSNQYNEALKRDLREHLIKSLAEAAKLEFQEQQRVSVFLLLILFSVLFEWAAQTVT